MARPRLSLVAGPIAMAILVASAAWVLWSNFERSKEASRSVEHTYNVLIASESFLSSVREVESSIRAYLLLRDRKVLAPYQSALAAQAQKLDELEQLTRDNARQQAGLKRIRELTAQRLAVLADAEKRTREGFSVVGVGVTAPGKGAQLMSALTAEVRGFESEERRLLAMRTNAAAQAETLTRLMLILTSSLLAIVLLFAGAAVERYVRTREASLEALQRQADLIDFSHDAVVTLNPAGMITGWNAGAEEIYGWTSAEAVGRQAEEILDTSAAGSKIEESLTRTGRWDGELTQTTKGGSKRIVESRYAQVRNRAGVSLGVLNISRDETQRRQAEELSRQVAEQRRLALDSAELGSWDYDVKLDRVMWDERCREILGLPNLGPASFEQAMKLVHATEKAPVREAAKAALKGQGGGRFQYELRVELRGPSGEPADKQIRWLATYGRVYFDESGRPIRVIGVNSDITERKRVEEALRESEDKLRVALETGRIGIFVDLVERNKIVFDERARQLLGLAEQTEIEPSEFLQRVHPDDRERILNTRGRDLQHSESDPGEVEYRILHPNGDVRWLVARRRIYFDGEKATRVLGVLLDVTEQKRAEQSLTEALAESDQERRRLGAILETMPAGVVLADSTDTLMEGNAEAVNIWRAGDFATLSKRIAGLKGWRAGSGEQMRPEEWPRIRALRGETVLGQIIDIERFDGTKGTVFNSASPVLDAQGVIQGAVGVMVDITEQRQIELALRRSEENLAKLLEQKNILFQEVQHRVKNNLQIVSSLLSLEAQRFEDSAFHHALNESRDRIRSMAMMHEKFYHLDDLARIQFSDYVEELARYFFSAYIADASAIGFTSEVDVKLSMNEAIPCGLILQELLSNSVKHAFPQGRGEIRVVFHEQEGQRKLCYWDSGPGLPETVDLENPGSLGLQLVTDLAAQLQGKIEYEYKNGSQFILTFGD